MPEKTIQEEIQTIIPKLFPILEPEFDWELVKIFYDFLKRDNEKGGFFSKNDSEKILERHILESLIFVWKLKTTGYVSRETNVADVGTGPGLPGFLFAVLKKAPQVFLVDSQKRKLALLEAEITTGSLSKVKKRVEFIYARTEEISSNFDVVTSRAMVPYPYLAEVTTRMVKQKGILCPFLAQPYQDLEKETEVLSNNGFVLKKEILIPELEFVGKRHIKILQKNSLPKKGYPRDWKEIVKETKSKNG
ncbi:RsmG family class I SAM-dependent methyltransferase [Leptospira biflexa]|jgi:16S rRNA (guanine527-N7)-methyltransferase|uniref:RsmG family class I SAM-dependent methyltransferase n=1 Tax=Leptospira biflexa TaxID=172 RepID=UPI001083321E|nr:RsmG family class I SAM-dependent methyltransferase [Leptospira biflexa]TGM37493.1 16S rRNA (guanine(527)-N(7))-methyltransferase RsmG [Leptospira biflexa]TGM40829.1 16S rRNA (guanine(527)-N(7))-methyltransferase RsmG [Leptospira biflexa]TGM55772.1 16S rRNA (guanine(527)-N(7))-methyltransferase RsmG [Leptospira biflexa]